MTEVNWEQKYATLRDRVRAVRDALVEHSAHYGDMITAADVESDLSRALDEPQVVKPRRYLAVKDQPTQGFYTIDQGDSGWRWLWREDGGEPESGPWLDSEAKALRDAAEDWERNGSGGRLAGTLRAAATRKEKNA